ncbi:MAG: hypothetical protein ACR2F2_06615 [Pyrinomonadaceae bacterium]
MIKIKIFAVAFILSLVGIIFYGSHHFSVSANDISNEIANYKTWSKITKEPITLKIDESSFVGG